jgi:putative transposase
VVRASILMERVFWERNFLPTFICAVSIPSMEKEIPGRPPHLKTIFRKYDPPLYFITICTHNRRPILAGDEFHQHFVEFMKRKAGQGVACGEYVIMPDHIHLFLRFDPQKYQLGRTVGFIKKSLSTPLREMGVLAPHWQSNFFDHVLRSADSYSDKWNYVRENPIRSGLVDCSSDWKYQGVIVPIRY